MIGIVGGREESLPTRGNSREVDFIGGVGVVEDATRGVYRLGAVAV